MKPLHVALVVVGAALAGGLAVKMTQPPAMQVAASAPAKPSVAPKPQVLVVSPTPVEEVATPAPPPVYERPKPFVPSPRPVEKGRVEKQPPPVAEKRTPEKRIVEKPVEVAEAKPPAMSPAPYQAPDPPPQRVVAPVVVPVPIPIPAPPPARQVVLQPGTDISVRLNQTLSTEHVVAGDTFQATLAEPLVVDGLIIAERGARVAGRVVDVQKPGRLNGSSQLQLGLSSIQTADGQRVAVSTEPWIKQGDSSRNDDLAKVGGGAALGAIIGAIAGGGKGAAIGAGVGGGAGVGAAAVGKAKPVNLPTETVIRFRLVSRVIITERPL